MADRNLRLQIILEALDKVTAPLKTITGASSAARRDLARTQDELKNLNALQSEMDRYKAKETRYGADIAAHKAAQERLTALRAQMEATEKPTKKLRTELEKVERQTGQLAHQIDAGGAELQQLSAKLSAAGVDVTELATHEDRLADKVRDANRALNQQTHALAKVDQATANSRKLNDISAKATTAGIGMVAAGTAAGAPVVAAVKQAMTLESAMADVKKVTDMAGPQLEQLNTDFLDLSERIPMTAAELANIAAAAGAAGVGMDKLGKPMANQRQQLLEFTNDAAEMGVAFDMTADVAGETMAKWRTAFELPQAGVRALGDRVNALTNTFGGKAANVTDIITRIGPLGKVAGLAAPQIAALGSTLDSIGVPSEVAATGIKNTMLALTKGEAATKSQVAAFDSLGLSATDVAKRMQKDATGAIVDVMERIGKLDAEKQSGILTQLFGSESVSAIAPMLTNLDGLKARLDLVADAGQTAGSMHAEFLNRIATSEGATGLAGNALSNLNITMGKSLLPTVVAVSEKVREASSAMRGWAQEHPGVAKGIMLFLGVGAGLLILLGGLALGFAAVTAAAAPLGIALGPLLAIVAAVAAVAAAGYLLYQNWDSIAPIFAPITAAMSGMFAKISGAASKFGTLLSLLWDGPLGTRVRIVMTLVQELAAIFVGAIGGTVMAVLNTLTGVVGAVFDFIGHSIGLVTALLTGDFAGAWTAVKGIWSAGMDALIAIVSGIWGIFKSIGGAAIDGIIAGLRAGWSAIKATVSELANLLPEWTRKLLGIHSPSRVFAEIGGHIMGGLDQGLSDNATGPLKQMAKVADSMTSVMAGATVAPPVLPKLSAPRADPIEPQPHLERATSIPAPVIAPIDMPAISAPQLQAADMPTLDSFQVQMPDIAPIEVSVSLPSQPIEWPIAQPVAPTPQTVSFEAPSLQLEEPREWPIVRSPLEALSPTPVPSVIEHAPARRSEEPREWPTARSPFEAVPQIPAPSAIEPAWPMQPPVTVSIDAPSRQSEGPLNWPIVRPVFETMAPQAAPILQPDKTDTLSIIPRIIESAAAIGRALTAGAAGAAVVAAPAAATPDSRTKAQAAPSQAANYYITVHAGGGADAQDIAAKVREELEKIEREKRGRGFHDED